MLKHGGGFPEVCTKIQWCRWKKCTCWKSYVHIDACTLPYETVSSPEDMQREYGNGKCVRQEGKTNEGFVNVAH